mgnify:CR=1 FL=1
MSITSPTVFIGVDVSQARLDVCYGPDASAVDHIDNTPAQIRAWIRHLPAEACIGVESTNTYHLELVQQAHERGLQVYLVNGYRLKHYAQAVGQRRRTDAIDARLIRRYLTSEIDHLVPFSPKAPEHVMLWKLMKQRARTIRDRVAMRQSWAELDDCKAQVRKLEQALKELLTTLEAKIARCIEQLGWKEEIGRAHV